MAIKRSGFGKTDVMPSNLARFLSAFDNNEWSSSSYSRGGYGVVNLQA
ncbi:MAG: hypothetical protein Q7J10_01770 [Methanosarcinaceae archaeon]|nr:hypothetical protein [Methanosarcinaceae archaeon]